MVKSTDLLTKLPPELRNRIYAYLLEHDEPLVVTTPWLDNLMTAVMVPAISQTSRQLRADTLSLFYSSNTFTAYIENFNLRPLIDWLHVVDPNCRHVHVRVSLVDKIRCCWELFELAQA